MPKLYVVPTPVGNLDDMTFRAVEVLKNVSLILCEDTRTSAGLLKHFGISTRTASHHKFNEHKTCSLYAERILGGETSRSSPTLVRQQYPTQDLCS